MSRGFGEVEREILDTLHGTDRTWIALSALRQYLCPYPPLRTLEDHFAYGVSWERSRHESINRAVRSLERKKIVRSSRLDAREGKAIWLADGPDPRTLCQTVHGEYFMLWNER